MMYGLKGLDFSEPPVEEVCMSVFIFMFIFLFKPGVADNTKLVLYHDVHVALANYSREIS